jgi:hypothetical protein
MRFPQASAPSSLSWVLMDSMAAALRSIGAKNAPFFLNFSYVCPEPDLVKRSDICYIAQKGRFSQGPEPPELPQLAPRCAKRIDITFEQCIIV